MVCCQRSGKNDPEQIAASFAQTTRREEGRGRSSTDFPHSAYDIRLRPRPPAYDDRALHCRFAHPAAFRDQNIVACFMGSLIAVVCLAG